MQSFLRSFVLLGFLGVAGLGATLVACGDDSCSLGESRCYGNETRVCSGPNDMESGNHFNTLGRTCVAPASCRDVVEDGLRVAVCSATGTKDARCSVESGSLCVDGTTLLQCDRRYVASETKCVGACVTSTVLSGAFCAASPTKEPVCASGSSPRCDGSSVVSCREGWVTARSVCDGVGARCVKTTTGFSDLAACVTDAKCAGKDDFYCTSKGTIEGCYGGSVVAMSCSPGTECRTYGSTAIGRQAECYPR